MPKAGGGAAGGCAWGMSTRPMTRVNSLGPPDDDSDPPPNDGAL
jgi:hypothetical protein